MQIRRATAEDADAACRILRRSIAELCDADHRGDAETLAQWLANKTPDNMRRWIAQTHVFVAAEGEKLLGVGAINDAGEIMLNYVAPEARFRGVSKTMLTRLEACARALSLSTVRLKSTATARRFYLAAGYRNDGAPQKGFGITFALPMAKEVSN